MHEEGQFILSGTLEEMAWLIGCAPEIVARCAAELQRTGTADVTLGNGNVTLLSRRLKRELSDREQTRLRVQRHRCNADVTAQSKSKSNKKEKEEEEGAAVSPPSHLKKEAVFKAMNPTSEYAIDTLIASFPEIQFTPAQLGHIESDIQDTPIDREAWDSTLTLYKRNYDPATKSYIPTKIGTLLDIFKQQKKRLGINENSNKSYREQRSNEAKQSFERTAEIRRRVEERDRQLSGTALPDSGRQLQLVESNADGHRKSGSV